MSTVEFSANTTTASDYNVEISWVVVLKTLRLAHRHPEGLLHMARSVWEGGSERLSTICGAYKGFLARKTCSHNSNDLPVCKRCARSREWPL